MNVQSGNNGPPCGGGGGWVVVVVVEVVVVVVVVVVGSGGGGGGGGVGGGGVGVDLREWKDDKPTKKGISLTLMRWKNWVDYLEYADQARTEKQNYKSHLGGNVYCTITEGSACMDIRQYWKPQEEVIPTKKGRYFILPVPNSVSGTCLCNILRHKVSQHNFHNIHLLNVDSKFRDTEYEVRSPQESPCISIDQIISGQK